VCTQTQCALWPPWLKTSSNKDMGWSALALVDPKSHDELFATARRQSIIHFARRPLVNQSGEQKDLVAGSTQRLNNQLEYPIGIEVGSENITGAYSCQDLELLAILEEVR